MPDRGNQNHKKIYKQIFFIKMLIAYETNFPAIFHVVHKLISHESYFVTYMKPCVRYNFQGLF